MRFLKLRLLFTATLVCQLASYAQAGTVNLAWDANLALDLAGYNVYRSQTSGSGYSRLNGALVLTPSYSDNTAVISQTYYYVVTAVSTLSLESGYSNEVTATVTGGPDLAITKSHSGNFTVGATGVYTLTVSNVGSAATTGTITVTDALPTGLGFVSGSGTGWSCSAAGQTVTCANSGLLAAGATSSVALTVTVAAAAVPAVTNTASVSTAGDTNAANNSASNATVVNGSVDLSITKSHSGNFTVGANGLYTLTVTNVGSAASSGIITVTDNLPTGLTFVSGAGTGWTCSASGQVVTCANSGSLASGASSSFALTVVVGSAAGANVTNTASVSNASDTNAANNTAADPTSINNLQPTISPYVFSPNGDGVNDTIAFQFSLSSPDRITIEVLDHNGTIIATPLNNANLSAGTATVNWNGIASNGSLANDGMYTCRIRGASTPAVQASFGINNSIPEVSKSWFLAEGSTVGFQTFVLVQNPNYSPTTVHFTFFKQDGTIKLYAETVPARTRTTVAIHDPIKGVPDVYSVSTQVQADLPIIVERAMYFNNNQGGTDSIGVTSTSKNWYFPGNHSFSGDEDFILIVNPSSSTATITATFILTNQAPITNTYTVVPNSRFTIAVHAVVPGTRVSVQLQSDVPVAAERSLYISNRQGGAAGIGAVSPSLTWYFAEGDTSALTSPAPATTLLEFFNPSNSTASVTVNYMIENGTVIAKNYSIAAQRRLTLDATTEIGSGVRFSLEVLSNTPIVAERLMFSGTDLGDSIGSPTPAYVWNLAEGFTAFGYETWIIVSNPGNQTANLTVYFLRQDGNTDTRSYTLAAKQRLTVYANSIVPPTSISTQVTSDQPIVVERTMKFANRQGIHQSMGVRQ